MRNPHTGSMQHGCPEQDSSRSNSKVECTRQSTPDVQPAQRGEDADGQDLPWALREPEEAHALLQAAAAGGMPAGRVERLALLHLLMRMHREAHARTGGAFLPVLSSIWQSNLLCSN